MFEPKITTPLQNVQAVELKYIHLELRYTPILDIFLKTTWLKDGSPIPASSRITENTLFGSAALKINPSYIEDSGNYSCTLTNPLGSAESTCTVTVTAAPTTHSQYVQLDEGK